MYGGGTTVAAAIGRSGLAELSEHFAHLADSQKIIGLDSGFTGHIGQRMLLPGF